MCSFGNHDYEIWNVSSNLLMFEIKRSSIQFRRSAEITRNAIQFSRSFLKGYIFSTGLKNRAASCIIIMRSETCLRISFHLASLSSTSRSSISWRRSEIPGNAEAPYKLNFPGAKMAFRDSGRPGSPKLFDKNQNE